MPWWLTRGVRREGLTLWWLNRNGSYTKAAFGNERGLCVLLIMICYARARAKVAKKIKNLPTYRFV
jgi:hypothetical protein